MTTVYEHIENGLYDFLSTRLNPVPIVISDASGLEHTTSYCVIRALNFDQAGQVKKSVFATKEGKCYYLDFVEGEFKIDDLVSLPFEVKTGKCVLIDSILGVSNTDVAEDYITVDYTTYVVNVRFQAIGKRSDQVISRIEKALTRDNEREVLAYDHNISLMRIENIRRTPQKRDTKFVESYTLDVMFSIQEFDIYGTNIIEDVVIGSIVTM